MGRTVKTKMGDIVFDIYKDSESGKSKVRVGNNLYTLNAVETEKLGVFLMTQASYQSEVAFPNAMRSMAIMFENGTVAMNLSIGSIGSPPKGFILMVTYAPPQLIRYDTSMFFLDASTLGEYIAALS